MGGGAVTWGAGGARGGVARGPTVWGRADGVGRPGLPDERSLRADTSASRRAMRSARAACALLSCWNSWLDISTSSDELSRHPLGASRTAAHISWFMCSYDQKLTPGEPLPAASLTKAFTSSAA